jgi:hypothetical protein
MKYFSFFLSLVLTIGLTFTHVSAKIFTDVPASHENQLAIDYLSDIEIFKGQGGSGLFEPSAPLNRAEWVTILVRLSGESAVNVRQDCFPDTVGQWYTNAVCYAQIKGWVKGYQSGSLKGKFGPDRSVSDYEVLVMLERFFDWSTSEGGDTSTSLSSSWFQPAKSYARQANILRQSDGSAVTRSEAAELIFRAIALDTFPQAEYYEELGLGLKGDLPDHISTVDPVIHENPGTLTVRTYEDSESQTIPKGAMNVEVLNFTLETSNDVVYLDKFSVKRTLVGSRSDIDKLSLLIDQQSIGGSVTVRSDNEATFQNLEYRIEEYSSALVTVMAHFREANTTGGQHAFTLDVSSIETSPLLKLLGGNVMGDTLKIGNVDASSVSVTNGPAFDVPRIDRINQRLASFNVSAGGHDVHVRRMTLTDFGSFPDDGITNFVLKANGIEVGRVDKMERGKLTFVLNGKPVLIISGGQKRFDIYGDTKGARRTDRVRFAFEEPYHLYAYDNIYGFGAQVNSAEFDGSSSNCAGQNTPTCPEEGLKF